MAPPAACATRAGIMAASRAPAKPRDPAAPRAALHSPVRRQVIYLLRQLPLGFSGARPNLRKAGLSTPRSEEEKMDFKERGPRQRRSFDDNQEPRRSFGQGREPRRSFDDGREPRRSFDDRERTVRWPPACR